MTNLSTVTSLKNRNTPNPIQLPPKAASVATQQSVSVLHQKSTNTSDSWHKGSRKPSPVVNQEQAGRQALMNGIATPRKKSVTNSNQLLKDLDQRIYGERDKFEMVFECPAWVAKPSDSRRDLVKMGRIELEAKLRSKWAHNFETYRGVERGGKALSENGEFQIQSRLEDYDRVMPLIAKDWDRFTQLVAKSVNPDRRKDNIGAILTHKESPSALYSYMVNIVGNAPLNQLIANSKRPAYFRQEVVFKAYWSFSDFDKVTRNSK